MKICILGKAPSWKDAPFDDESIEIWALNDGVTSCFVPRFDRTFDVHIPSYYKKIDFYSQKHIDWLKNNQHKLWILDKCEDFPNANIIDCKTLVNKYGKYFTNSIAWMIAIALEYEHLTDIYICGVDLMQKSEWEFERPCVEYFIGIAKGRGINVQVQPTSTLLKSDKLYGIM